jgi:diguanylate cyclase (GGDEF)-like protein
MIDVDRFKLVNDTYGHLAGDAVLREAARRMTAAVRRYDSVGRYGGEEFLIVLPGCGGASALAQAERIREAFADLEFCSDSQHLQVTCSIGVSSRPCASAADADPLLREADLALYKAKDSGRDQVAEAPQLASV